MNLTIAETSGFCEGVKQAYEKVDSFLDNHKGDVIYTQYELVHNPSVNEKLQHKGLKMILDISVLKKGEVCMINAHGDPKTIEKAKLLGLEIVDATCSKVKYSQNMAKRLKGEGYTIIFLGEPEHIEVKGVVDYIRENIFVVENVDEVKKLGFPKDQKIAFLSQTTQRPEKFEEIEEYLKQNYENLKAVDTICLATKERQEEAKNLSKQVDIMIVVGGFKSSNTKKLVEICKKNIITYHIETSEDIKDEWFEDKEKAGLIAGASTPDWIIDGVVSRIREL